VSGLLAVGVVGCGQHEAAAPTPDAGASATNATAGAVAGLKQVAADAGQEIARQAEVVKKQAQGVIDQVKTLIAEKKYDEALGLFKKLGEIKLTPEQQKLVDDLKAQVQKLVAAQATKALTDEAAKAAGNLLPK